MVLDRIRVAADKRGMATRRPPQIPQVLMLLGLGLGLGFGATGCEEAEPEVAQVNAPVKVYAQRVEQTTARHFVYGQGNARAVRRELMSFEADGRVAYIKESSEGRQLQVGDEVRGPEEGEEFGELLASLDNRERAASVSASEAALLQTRDDQAVGRADVRSAESEYRNAKAEFDRTKALYDAKAVARAELDQSQARLDTAAATVASAKARRSSSKSGTTAQQAELTRARVTLEKGSIFAPFDGVVAYLNVEEGDFFYSSALAGKSEDERLGISPIVVIDPSEYEVTLHIPAFESQEIERGQSAVVLTGAQVAELASGQKLFAEGFEPTFAEVYAVSPSIDPGSRTVEVKLRTTADDERLRDGEFVSAWIITKVSENTRLIPFDAVIRHDEGPQAFVVDEQTMAVSARPLSFGIRDVAGLEVLEGVAAGELVVTDGRHAITEGTRVEVVGERQRGTRPELREVEPAAPEGGASGGPAPTDEAAGEAAGEDGAQR